MIALLALAPALAGCRGGEDSADKLPTTPAEFAAGQEVYDSGCASCHDTSHDGAPRLGYVGAWERRIKQDESVLVQHALEGKGMMPPKGDMPELTDEQVAQAVRYMIYRAGLGIPAKH